MSKLVHNWSFLLDKIHKICQRINHKIKTKKNIGEIFKLDWKKQIEK